MNISATVDRSSETGTGVNVVYVDRQSSSRVRFIRDYSGSDQTMSIQYRIIGLDVDTSGDPFWDDWDWPL